MLDSQLPVPALIAATLGLGVMLLLVGARRLRRRAATSRRLSALVVEAAPVQLPPGASATPSLRTPIVNLGPVIAVVQSFDATLRPPITALAIIAALMGLATISVAWLIVASA
jgi:hypothetical protein